MKASDAMQDKITALEAEIERLKEAHRIYLIDLYIGNGTDIHNVWIGSLKHPGEGGEFSKTAVNAVLKKFYEENL